MVGLIAVRAAADENTAKEKALRTTAQENSPATTQATAAVAAERARSGLALPSCVPSTRHR